MSLSADTLLDRLRLKAQLRRWRVIGIAGIVLGFLGFAGIMSAPGIGSFERGEYIARINIENIILEDQERDEILQEIRNNKHIKAVILRINSPGGTMVGGETLYQALREIAEKKPMVTVMGSVAASGGYMAAIASDHLLAQKGTITGSIGVYLQSTEFTGLADKIGVKFDAIKSAPLKGSPAPFEKMTPEVRKAIQETVDDDFHTFVEMVAERRQMSKEKVLVLADGRVYTGRQAVANKLIDGIGGEKEARAWLEKEKKISSKLEIKEIKLKKRSSEIEEFLSSAMGKASLIPEELSLQGVLTLWHAGIFNR